MPPPVTLVAVTTRLSERRTLVLLLALTSGTGIVDAACYLGLGRVFTGNMTGNVVILGMGLAGAEDLPVAGPLVALAGFFAGAALAGRFVRGRRGWGPWTSTVLGAVAVALGGVAVALLVVDESPHQSFALVLTAVLATAMGGQAAAARAVGFRELTTVAVTANLVGLASDTWPGRDSRQVGVARGLAVVAIVLGAAVGALVVQWHLAAAVAAATAVVATVTVAAWAPTSPGAGPVTPG